MIGPEGGERFRAQVDPAAWALFCALRFAPTAADRRLLAALDREEWRRVGQLALQTFSAPLVYANLREAGLLGSVPDEVQMRLGRVHAWNLARNTALLAQLEVVTRALAAAGVTPMVLKGAHLARWYPHLAARAMGDIDLVVRRTELPATQAALLGLGYGPPDRAPVDLDALRHHHLPAFTRGDAVPIEVHWSLNEGPQEEAWEDGVWARAVPLPDQPAVAMEPLDALLFACRHLAVHHGFSTTNGLAGLADVALLMTRERFAPDALADRVQAWDLAPGVFLCLLLARDLLGAPVSDAQLRSVEVPDWEGPAASAVWTLLHVGGLGLTRDLLFPTRATLNPPPPASAIFGPERWAAALSYVKRASLPPVDDMALEFRALRRRPLCYLAYPLHWTRLAYSHAGLLRLARPTVREEYRRTFQRRRREILEFVGASAPA